MRVFKFIVHTNDTFPNNEGLPLLLYKNAVEIPGMFPARRLLNKVKKNGWHNGWKNGIFDYHHYHSNTHEVLVAYSGSAIVQLGGEEGLIITFSKGDVLIIPAGVAHKNMGDRDGFACIGAYPNGMDYDMNYGKIGERPETDKNIAAVPVPFTDPISGDSGPVIDYWINSLSIETKKKKRDTSTNIYRQAT